MSLSSTPRRYLLDPSVDDLSEAMLMLQTAADIERFMRELCSMRELQMLKDRWVIAKLISMGFSYRIIAHKTGASTATISRLSQSLAGGGELLRTCKRREEVLARQFSFYQEKGALACESGEFSSEE